MPENDPAAVGENRTVTERDCPGNRVNAPCPLTTENGAERGDTFTFSVLAELIRLVIVTVWSEDCPNVTSPKFTDEGVMEILTVTSRPVPLNGMFVGLV